MDKTELNNPVITPLVRERQMTNHSSDLSHSSINHIIDYDNHDIQKILDVEINQEDIYSNNLEHYTSLLLETKFQQAIRTNVIQPKQNDKKNFKMKIYKNSKNIKDIISKNIDSDDPKIIDFIHSTIDLITQKGIKTYTRNFTSIHNKIFTKINFSSILKSYRFLLFRNYIKFQINILSISFL